MRNAIRTVGLFTLLMGLWSGVATAQVSSPPYNQPGALPSVLGSPDMQASDSVELTSGTYAVFHTSEGDFLAELKPEWAPAAVENFVALASGYQRWRHPVTLEETTRPLFSNTSIYRTIPNAMISGGDPLNKGEADSGMQLPLEAKASVPFDAAGLLAMDGSGDKMSGSRWFITLRPFPDRTGKNSIFGKIIGGLDIIQKISLKPVRRPQLPLDPVMLFFVEIIRIPPGRMTTGTFKTEGGLRVLRVEQNFKDAPEPTELAVTAAGVEATTETESADIGDSDSAAKPADSDNNSNDSDNDN